ncbi:hypothetical protein [Rhizobium leguminosarum]|uniref:nSTAND3 domain-containing NTPase n=1 Tax=Rhizobium leguminosarum TaxID=384 RepID=UPI0032B229BC
MYKLVERRVSGEGPIAVRVLSLRLNVQCQLRWDPKASARSENPDDTVLALTSPRDFEAGWNPNDPGHSFWIDDAFGSNVLRNDYVQDLASALSKLCAAVAHGNRFLLTSRKHLYEAAQRRLGQRNVAVRKADLEVSPRLGRDKACPSPYTSRQCQIVKD